VRASTLLAIASKEKSARTSSRLPLRAKGRSDGHHARSFSKQKRGRSRIRRLLWNGWDSIVRSGITAPFPWRSSSEPAPGNNRPCRRHAHRVSLIVPLRTAKTSARNAPGEAPDEHRAREGARTVSDASAARSACGRGRSAALAWLSGGDDPARSKALLALQLSTPCRRVASSPFRATQVRRRRGNEARRGAKAGLRPLSWAATRSRQLFCIHMAKEPPATDEGSLLLVASISMKAGGLSSSVSDS